MKNKAHELYGWLQNAVWDCAQGELMGITDDPIKIEAKADKLFDDPGTCRDLLGDRVFDAVKSNLNDGKALELCNHLLEIGHGAVKKAMTSFIEDHKLN